MPYIVHDDGTAEGFDPFDNEDMRRFDKICARYEDTQNRVFGTLLGAVTYGGVVATAFDRPFRAERVYDAETILNAENPMRALAEAEPVGVVGSFNIFLAANGRGFSKGVQGPDAQ